MPLGLAPLHFHVLVSCCRLFPLPSYLRPNFRGGSFSLNLNHYTSLHPLILLENDEREIETVIDERLLGWLRAVSVAVFDDWSKVMGS